MQPTTGWEKGRVEKQVGSRSGLSCGKPDGVVSRAHGRRDEIRGSFDAHRVDFWLDTERRLGLTSREAIYQAYPIRFPANHHVDNSGDLRGGPTGMRGAICT
jgi:hypothetical protein